MAGLRVIIVMTSLVFALGWCGLLQVIFQEILSLVPLPSNFFRVQYVQDQQYQDSDYVDDVQDESYDNFERNLKENERQMREQLTQVIIMMEEFLKDSETGEMSQEEIADTFDHLGAMFPVIDKLFNTLLHEKSVSNINPEADYHETHRRYLTMKREIEKKRQSKPTLNDDDITINNANSLDDDGIVADEL
ncbi:uncharacterized protein [Palaemon carinicauda]|uniref:uncharacterized protein n=1 Tax=Palaemon carinicauda TaxID=392227 RepID=UPI0035B6695F